MNKPIPPGGGALNEMSLACAERACNCLYGPWLAKRGLTAEITTTGPYPPEVLEQKRREIVERLRRERAERTG